MALLVSYARKFEIFTKLLIPIVRLISITKYSTSIEMPILHSAISFFFELIGAGIIIFGLSYAIRLMKLFQKGEIFSWQTTLIFRKITFIALTWTIYSIINDSLQSVIQSWHKGPGNRILSITLGSNDLMNVFVVGFFVIIAAFMHEATILKQDQDLTV